MSNPTSLWWWGVCEWRYHLSILLTLIAQNQSTHLLTSGYQHDLPIILVASNLLRLQSLASPIYSLVPCTRDAVRCALCWREATLPCQPKRLRCGKAAAAASHGQETFSISVLPSQHPFSAWFSSHRHWASPAVCAVLFSVIAAVNEPDRSLSTILSWSTL